jgi:hypothetical protein
MVQITMMSGQQTGPHRRAIHIEILTDATI